MRQFLYAVAMSACLPVAAAADDVTVFTLDNGMQGVVIEDHRAPVVTQMVWYRAGAADEQPGQSGVAHFLEHLMFKGTEQMAPGEFSRVVAANGGHDNAFTTHDQTAYFQRIAADRLELVMRMEADRMRNLQLSEEDVATEREVILEERAQRTDSSPERLFGEQLSAAQFLNHPYGRPVIGWRSEMESLDRQDALDWYRRYYAPNNAVLVVAGDVDPAEVERLARLYYGPLAPSEGIVDRVRPAEPPQRAERRLSFTDPNISQPYLIRQYMAPERDSGYQSEAAALTILAELLGGNPQTSVLARKLSFDAQIAVQAGVSYDGTSLDDTVFTIYVAPLPGVAMAKAEAALDSALDGFLKQGVDPAQFERVKRRMAAELVFRKDKVRDMAEDYGSALTTGLTVADVEAWPAALAAVSEDDLMAAAARLLDRRASVTGWAMQSADAEVMQ